MSKKNVDIHFKDLVWISKFHERLKSSMYLPKPSTTGTMSIFLTGLNSEFSFF